MKNFICALACIPIAWCIGYSAFVLDATSYDEQADVCCENIVVLTGGRNRLRHAIRSMETRKPKSIFISGVNRKTSLKDIFKNKSTEGVSIILEKQAKNTRENALEINTWLKSNKVQEILLITSDYHMYRSIVELRHLNDGLKIYPCSVKSEFNFNFVRNCAKEFHKVIYIYVKRLLEKF